MNRLELFREFVRAVNRNGEPANEIVIARRNEIGETTIELAGRLLHLLPQETKTRVRMRKIDIVADCASVPESEDAARDERFLCDDLLQNFLRIIEKLARLFSNRRIVKDRRISAA